MEPNVSSELNFVDDHQSHNGPHLILMPIMILSIIATQYFLKYWQKNYFNSYFKATLFLMWILPIIFSIYNLVFKMILFWSIYTAAVFYLLQRVRKNPLSITTPRLVYSSYLYCHLLSELAVSLSLPLFIISVFSTNETTSYLTLQFSFTLLFCGLYYGLLTRDIACLLTDIICIRLGMVSSTEIPKTLAASNICALCGLLIVDTKNDHDEINVSCVPGIDLSTLTSGDRIIKLDCGHQFHDFCIRGWILIGKKDSCPSCRENVNLRKNFVNPWEVSNLYYGDILYVLRYLLAWHPLLAFSLYGISKLFGLN
uniref:RING finger protein 121 (Trinotate prediction) n=1 Tax=Myxobolus squamalis TaxID=59785 RepID=A0A6B2G721_MYXSQ